MKVGRSNAISTHFTLAVAGSVMIFLPGGEANGQGVSDPAPQSIRLIGTIRDFSQGHPDFSIFDASITGHFAFNVSSDLGADRRPVFLGGGLKVLTQCFDKDGNPIAPFLSAVDDDDDDDHVDGDDDDDHVDGDDDDDHVDGDDDDYDDHVDGDDDDDHVDGDDDDDHVDGDDDDDSVLTDSCGNSIEDVVGTYGGSGNGGVSSNDSFNQWFRDMGGVNLSMGHSITLVRDAEGVYEYLSDGFYPADGVLLENQSDSHNNNFTYAIEAKFEYDACTGLFFEFEGNDDCWVFINGRLVIDLGGVETPTRQYVALDRLGLSDGESCTLNFFYAQRRDALSSVFRMRTNIPMFTTTGPTVSAAFD